MDAQEYDTLVALKARIEALAEEARAIQKRFPLRSSRLNVGIIGWTMVPESTSSSCA